MLLSFTRHMVPIIRIAYANFNPEAEADARVDMHHAVIVNEFATAASAERRRIQLGAKAQPT